MNKLQKKIGWEPHDAQKKILASDSKDIVICAGRRFGKSALCAYVILEALVKSCMDILDGKDVKPARIWIVAPNYDLTDKVFQELIRFFLKVFPDWGKCVTTRTPAMIKTPLGPEVRCKSADNPQSLLGEELDLLVIDECSRVKKSTYEVNLYPTTTNRPNCRRFYISTPFGKNWFYDEWLRAKKKGGAFHFTTKDNTTIVDVEKMWEDSKSRLPADVFAQEFEAAFLDSASAVFRGVRDCIDARLEGGKEPQRGHQYLMGVDIAKFNDFTVLTVIDKNTHEVVAIDRFNKIDYPLQKRRIYSLANKYGAKIVMDAMNAGASISDDLKAEGLHIIDFKAAEVKQADWQKKSSKVLMIDKLSSFIQEKNIKIPPNQALIDELEAFGYTMTESGNITYEAPPGLHDDMVNSLGLAVWLLQGKTKRELTEAVKSIPPAKKPFQYV